MIGLEEILAGWASTISDGGVNAAAGALGIDADALARACAADGVDSALLHAAMVAEASRAGAGPFETLAAMLAGSAHLAFLAGFATALARRGDPAVLWNELSESPLAAELDPR